MSQNQATIRDEWQSFIGLFHRLTIIESPWNKKVILCPHHGSEKSKLHRDPRYKLSGSSHFLISSLESKSICALILILVRISYTILYKKIAYIEFTHLIMQESMD